MNVMFETYAWLTGAVLVVAGLHAYTREKSAIHPLVILGPIFLYGYCVSPLILFYSGRFEYLFPDPSQIEYVQGVYCLAIVCFVIGALRATVAQLPGLGGVMSDPSGENVTLQDVATVPVEDPEAVQIESEQRTLRSPSVRRRLYEFGLTLGGLGVLAYSIMIANVGGLFNAYSRAKGGGRSISGYIGEGPLLIYPGLVLIALALRGRKLAIHHYLIALAIAAPQLIHGTLGGRRGPLFLILSTMFFCYFIVRDRTPSLKIIIGGVLAILLAVVAMWSQRQTLYLGSDDASFTQESVLDKFLPKEDEVLGHFYVYGAGVMLNSRFHNRYGWGRRYFVTLFVRPIPHQIWPTKYEDTMGPNKRDQETEWRASLGWIPLDGSASGMIADSYAEFGLGCIIVAYLMGRFVSSTWRKSQTKGGVWQVLYIEILILGIYLPTQSLSAFWHRFLFMTVPTWLAWRYYISPPPKKKDNDRASGSSGEPLLFDEEGNPIGELPL